MKIQLAVGVTGLFLAATVATALADKVAYEFSFTGRQLTREYITATGADGSTAVDNHLYSGARRFNGYNNGDVFSSFEASSQGDLIHWMGAGDHLMDINLWGYGGNSANWGESYKVDKWNSASVTDTNWDSYIDPWPSGWGTPPDNNNGDLRGWWVPSGDYDEGISFNQSSYPTFTFTLTLDTDDPAFGSSSPWYRDDTGLLAFWFGAETMNWQGTYTGRYEGNLLLRGKKVDPVPEPSTILLFGAGLVGLLGASRRKKSKPTA